MPGTVDLIFQTADGDARVLRFPYSAIAEADSRGLTDADLLAYLERGGEE